MTTELMTTDTSSTPQPTRAGKTPARDLEPTIQDILSKARTNRPAARGAWLCAGLSGTLLWAAFTPLDWGFLGWLCLVPLILLVRIETRTAWMYRAVYAAGLVNALVTLQWMRLGDVSMYPAWWALSVYLACYFPAFVAASRIAVHRFRMPLTLAVPLVWVGLEYLRAHLLTGFSWYYLGHTQYRWLEIIQVSDLVGAYGVSFLVAMTAATLAALVPASVFRRLGLVLQTRLESGAVRSPQRPGWMVAATFVVFAAVLAYGYVRRGQAEFQAGPRVALVQGNFESSLKHDPEQFAEIFRVHDALTGEAVRHHPDLIVWPETMFRWPLAILESGITDEELLALAPPEAQVNPQRWLEFWHDRQAGNVLRDRSQAANAALMIGVDTYTATPGQRKHFNSAVFVRPDTGMAGRYDKIHRVIFGEYIPLKDSLPWLHTLTPFSSDFGIDAGNSFRAFSYAGWTFSPVICFEDTVPHVVRGAARARDGEKPVDCLVNLTNDGWFHGSSELDQHLITAAFRAVECRKPVVRSVNTGISAFIDGDGAVVEPEVFIDADRTARADAAPLTMRDPQTGRWRKSLNALLVHPVPLDNRGSLYLAWGDWFSGGCGAATLFLLLGGIFLRPRRSDVTPAEKQSY